MDNHILFVLDVFNEWSQGEESVKYDGEQYRPAQSCCAVFLAKCWSERGVGKNSCGRKSRDCCRHEYWEGANLQKCEGFCFGEASEINVDELLFDCGKRYHPQEGLALRMVAPFLQFSMLHQAVENQPLSIFHL